MANAESDGAEILVALRSPRSDGSNPPPAVAPIQRALSFESEILGESSRHTGDFPHQRRHSEAHAVFSTEQGHGRPISSKRAASASPTREPTELRPRKPPLAPREGIAMPHEHHRDATPRASSRLSAAKPRCASPATPPNARPTVTRRTPSRNLSSDDRAPSVKTGRPPSEVWLHFYEDVSNQKKTAVCKYCSHRVNNPKPAKNLIPHLLRHCKMVSADVKTDLIQSTSDNVPSTQAEFPSKSVEPDAEPNPVQVDQETFNLMLVQLVVICALPFAILDSKFFRNFISILAPHLSVPPRQYFTKSVLEDVEKDIRQQVIKRINKQKFVSVVMDGWTDPNGAKIVNFMVVAPEMPSLFWKSCATGADEQSGEKIAQLIKSVIDDIHSVTTARVVGIVTDNASNMLDSWRNLKYSLSKLAIVGGGCAAHVLNLLMKDLFHHKALKKVSSSAVALTRFVRDHLALLDTFRSILESSRASGHKRSGLTLPVPTRWYSVFNCLENVFNNRDVFEEIFTGPHHSELLKRYRRSKASREKLDFMISLVEDPEFWEQLRITIRLIRPIQKALGELESDTQYASSVYKWFRYLRNHEYYRARTNATAPAADTVASSENAVEESDEPPDIPIVANYKPFTTVGPGVLEKLFRDKIQERWRYVHTSAMGNAFFLDPRASHDDFEPGDERKTREAAIRFVLEAQLVSNDEIPKLTSELFEYAHVKSGETGLAQTSPKTYWESVRREFPILGRVADVVFAIPPSSAASERAWSIFNHVHTKSETALVWTRWSYSSSFISTMEH